MYIAKGKTSIEEFIRVFDTHLTETQLMFLKKNPTKLGLTRVLRSVNYRDLNTMLAFFDLGAYSFIQSPNKEKHIADIIAVIKFKEEIKKEFVPKDEKKEEYIPKGKEFNIKEFLELIKNKDNIVNLDKNNEVIQITSEIIFYNDIDITYLDNYKVFTNKLIKNYSILVDADDKYLGYFNLENIEDEYYLLADKNDFNLKNRLNKNYYLYFISVENKQLFRINVNLKVRDLEYTDELLCLDFGTSNSSVGIYLPDEYVPYISSDNLAVLNKTIKLNEINFVKFKKQNEFSIEHIEILPTTVYIKNCQNDKIEYLFGYDAVKKIKEEDYSPKGKIFRSIKNWLSDINAEEYIFDINGNERKVKRKVILKDYLEYIIEIASQQFKCKFKNLHLTTPINLKSHYLRYYKEILSENYNIKNNNDSIDEGFASLYNTIKSNWDNLEPDKTYKAVVIDSGGGTTDLAGCEFKKTDNYHYYKLNIVSSGLNSSSFDFGGDKITERIMQYMKVLYSSFYKGNHGIKIDDFIPPNEDIFGIVDSDGGVDKLYENLIKEYNYCEEIIPTNYNNYKNKSQREFNMVLNNYHFLWELAEEMKKQFYKNNSIQRNKFYDNISNESHNIDLNVILLSKWSLSYYNNNELVKVKEKNFPDIIFTIREINQLIRGDIYNIIKRLLGKMYENDSLRNYKIIKLSGQSCRIDLFRESLKEYIPGRALSYNNKKTIRKEKEYLELKLGCLRGTIDYFNDIDNGLIDPIKLETNAPIPFSVTTKNYRGEELILINHKLEPKEAIGNIITSIGTRNLFITLRDSDNNIVKKFEHKINIKEYKEIDVSELNKIYPINQKLHIDELNNGDSNFIFYVDMENYGFHILNIKKFKNNMYLGENKFYRFDKN